MGRRTTKKAKEVVHPTMGLKIRATREWRGLTGPELADRLHVTKGSVSNWETGKVTPPYGQVVAIADVLKVPVEFLWDHGVPVMLLEPQG